MAKARYYGLSTVEERNDVKNGSRIYQPNGGKLSYSAVKTAILNYKDDNPGFDSLPVQVAADRIAHVLNATNLFGTVRSNGARVEGAGYSVALTKGKELITISHASERKLDNEKK